MLHLVIFRLLPMSSSLLIWCTALCQDASGEHGVNNGNSFVHEYRATFIVTLIIFTLVRSSWNRKTYNRLHDTNYLPGIYETDPDNNWINFMCLFIFWWPTKARDSGKAKRLKRTANRVSLISTIIVVPVLLLLILF